MVLLPTQPGSLVDPVVASRVVDYLTGAGKPPKPLSKLLASRAFIASKYQFVEWSDENEIAKQVISDRLRDKYVASRDRHKDGAKKFPRKKSVLAIFPTDLMRKGPGNALYIPGFRLAAEISQRDHAIQLLEEAGYPNPDLAKFWALVWREPERRVTKRPPSTNKLSVKVGLLPSLSASDRKSLAKSLKRYAVEVSHVKERRSQDYSEDDIEDSYVGLIGKFDSVSENNLAWMARGKGLHCVAYGRDLQPGYQFITPERQPSKIAGIVRQSVATHPPDVTDAFVQTMAMLASKKNMSREYFKDLAKFLVVDTCKMQLMAAQKGKLTVDLNSSLGFLKYASIYFSTAEELYAVSVDVLSRFWINNRAEAMQYLDVHQEKTVRLFVFSDPKQIDSYSPVLDLHSQKYGSDGAVFVCSWKHYLDYLRQSPQKDSRIPDNDFGVIAHKGDGLQVAFFAGNSLQIERLEHLGADAQAFFEHHRATMIELRNKVAQGSHNFDDRDALLKVLRWPKKGDAKDEPLNNFTKRAFAQTESAMYHMLVLKGPKADSNVKHLREAVHAMEQDCGDPGGFKTIYGIEDFGLGHAVPWGDVVKVAEFDPQFHEPLGDPSAETVTSDRGPSGIILPHIPAAKFVYWVKFKSESYLYKYHTDDLHFKKRMEFYKAVEPRLVKKCDMLLSGALSPEEHHDVSCDVENAMFHHIERFIYKDIPISVELPQGGIAAADPLTITQD